MSPQFLDGELIGTVDSSGITGVPGPPAPEKCNDYIAAIAAAQPDVFIGYASVNPNYRGPRAAVRELERAVTELGLHDPAELRAKLLSVNDHAERVGATPIPAARLDGILGDNFARMSGLLADPLLADPGSAP